jgi:hypothetical protein
MKLSIINNIGQPGLVADDAWMFDTGSPACSATRNVRPLTDTEASSVEVVTIRESTRHRRWPRGVVSTFLMAGVDRPRGQEVV